MNIQNIEKKEKNMATFEVKVPADVFDNAVNEVYKKNKNHLYVAGFRKGKAPRAVIEGMYHDTEFRLLSADYISFCPRRILP